jgi:glycosyltransferase AglD
MLSVYIPAYNEGEIISSTVDKVVKALDGIDYELTVVDDASTDDTGEICKAFGEKIKYVKYDFGPTRRENLACEMKNAPGDKIAYLDADLSVDPIYLPNFNQFLEEYDIVIASRYLPESKTTRSLWRDAFSRLSSSFVRHYLGSGIVDHQCGFKAFRRDCFMSLYEDMGYDKTLKRGWCWDTELLIRAQRRGYKILEIPVQWRESTRSSVDITRDWKMIVYALSLKKRI